MEKQRKSRLGGNDEEKSLSPEAEMLCELLADVIMKVLLKEKTATEAEKNVKKEGEDS